MSGRVATSLSKSLHNYAPISVGYEPPPPKTYHVVEPHADDAFLSLHAHMSEWIKSGSNVIIHTITGDPKRMREAETYATAIGAGWLGYGVKDDPDALTWFEAINLATKGQVILPLSIKHPTHTAVRVRLQDRRSWYYVDQPYAVAQSSSAATTELLKGFRVVSYIKPHVRKYKHVPTFKTQAKFFHFNPVAKLKETFEMIVER